jgi:hypothetical protein
MRTVGDFQRVENMVGTGMPDVNYCIEGVEGWIELKQTQGWPRFSHKPLVLDHYTPQQRLWHRRRTSAGGRVYVMLQIVRPCTYVLLPARWSAEHLGLDATQADIEVAALIHSLNQFPHHDAMALSLTG